MAPMTGGSYDHPPLKTRQMGRSRWEWNIPPHPDRVTGVRFWLKFAALMAVVLVVLIIVSL
jgi:hypothetical protein